jgi:FKBP-type peptidyl-prolyl cis-trans isomerase FklB
MWTMFPTKTFLNGSAVLSCFPGWTEALQLMKEGGKWELYIPSELGYGDRGAGGQIPGGAVLIFELELLKVKGDYVKEL